MSVLRTAWRTRWVYLLTLGLTLAWGLAGGAVIRWMTELVLGPHGGEGDPGHALGRLAEVVLRNPELAAGASGAALITAAVAWLGWTALGGVVFYAARGDGLAASAQGAVSTAGPLLVQGLVHAVLAGVGLLVLSIILGPISPLLRVLGLLIGAAIAILARDLVRAQICLHGIEHPYHPRITAHGFVRAVRRPKELAISGGLWTLKMALALALAPLAVRALGPDSAGLQLRSLTALGLALSFVRLAWVTHWVPIELEAEPSPDDDGAKNAES